MPVSKFYDAFHNLISSYKPAEGFLMERSSPIVQLIQDDWEVFSDRLVELNREGPLLEAIMDAGWDDDSGEPRLSAYDHYVAHDWSHETLDEIWEQFAEDVKKDPALPLKFIDPIFDDFLISEDLLGRRTVQLPAGTTFYRARLGFTRDPEGINPYMGSEIGAPPPDKATPGRANAKGQAVLYCADQEGTAVAEVRPARGEYVSVAALRASKELEILDLVTKPEWPNPFTDETVQYWMEFGQLLMAFGEQLEKPLQAA